MFICSSAQQDETTTMAMDEDPKDIDGVMTTATIPCTLIATVMFASAFPVPGGHVRRRPSACGHGRAGQTARVPGVRGMGHHGVPAPSWPPASSSTECSSGHLGALLCSTSGKRSGDEPDGEGSSTCTGVPRVRVWKSSSVFSSRALC